MRRPLLFVALALLAGVFLAVTVFREQVAYAAQAVNATIVGPLDGGGNIKVHEQGTANVNVTNSTLPIAPAAPITGGGAFRILIGGGSTSGPTETATAFSINLSSGVNSVLFFYQGSFNMGFAGPGGGGNSSIVLALTRPVSFDEFVCNGLASERCSISWVGAEP